MITYIKQKLICFTPVDIGHNFIDDVYYLYTNIDICRKAINYRFIVCTVCPREHVHLFVWLCFVRILLQILMVIVVHFTIFYWYCPGTSEVKLKDMGKFDRYQAKSDKHISINGEMHCLSCYQEVTVKHKRKIQPHFSALRILSKSVHPTALIGTQMPMNYEVVIAFFF